MPKLYGKDQPQGFTNRIEKVAIVGVRSYLSTLLVMLGPDSSPHRLEVK
jgi:hypothetical protein